MAAAEHPADAYIGSCINLISKSEIRYLGVLYNLNPSESTITLHNVKSFGTEGRKKEGPQVLASNVVYDYIFFRGSEIKDLQVISSQPAQETSALPNDPAIIQSHCPPSASTPSSFSSISPVPATNASSFSQYGLPNSSLQGNLVYNQSTGILGSWGLSPPHPTTNCNGIKRSACWPDHSGSSNGASYFQEQPLVQTPRDPVPSSSMPQQLTQSSTMSASIAGDGLNILVCSRPITSTVPSPSTSPFSNPIYQYDAIPPNLYSNPIPRSAFSVLPTLPIISSSPSMDKPRSILEPTLACQSISPPVPSFVRSSSTGHRDALMLSLSNAGHIPQPDSTDQSPSQIHVAQKDIEVVQESTPSFLSKSECDTNPTECVLVPKKLNEAAVPYHKRTKHQAQERRKRYVKAVNTPQKVGDYYRASEKLHSGAAFHYQCTYRGCGRGRENRLNQVFVSTHQVNSDRAREIRPKISTVAGYVYPNDKGHVQWRRKQVTSKITKFTDDFDFEVMYKKFNKKEIWGHLGKKNENLADEEDDLQYPKFDSKPVYAKDDFFDTLSSNLSSPECGRGRSKMSEQNKLDLETFGESVRVGRGSRGFEQGRGGKSRSSHSGRGHGLMPVYPEDDFSGARTGNLSCYESGKGKSKLPDQEKLDHETFGETSRFRRVYRSSGTGRDGRPHGSHSGKSRQMVWVCVT